MKNRNQNKNSIETFHKCLHGTCSTLVLAPNDRQTHTHTHTRETTTKRNYNVMSTCSSPCDQQDSDAEVQLGAEMTEVVVVLVLVLAERLPSMADSVCLNCELRVW